MTGQTIAPLLPGELRAVAFAAECGIVNLSARGIINRGADEIERLRRIETLARELITAGMVQRGDGLVVIERKDKSDPHYRLCVELGL